MKITFVCLGNICRSPMAEFIAKNYCITNNLKIDIDSCGTSSYHQGEDMHYGTRKILETKKIRCDGFSSKPINKNIFDESSFIIVMDNQNKIDVEKKFGKNNKIMKVTDFCTLNYQNVPDPWYTNDFDETFKILDNSIKNFLIKLFV